MKGLRFSNEREKFKNSVYGIFILVLAEVVRILLVVIVTIVLGLLSSPFLRV